MRFVTVVASKETSTGKWRTLSLSAQRAQPLSPLPDAKRAVYLAVDAMLKADEKRRVLDASVCGAVVEVLLVDD